MIMRTGPGPFAEPAPRGGCRDSGTDRHVMPGALTGQHKHDGGEHRAVVQASLPAALRAGASAVQWRRSGDGASSGASARWQFPMGQTTLRPSSRGRRESGGSGTALVRKNGSPTAQTPTSKICPAGFRTIANAAGGSPSATGARGSSRHRGHSAGVSLQCPPNSGERVGRLDRGTWTVLSSTSSASTAATRRRSFTGGGTGVVWPAR